MVELAHKKCHPNPRVASCLNSKQSKFDSYYFLIYNPEGLTNFSEVSIGSPRRGILSEDQEIFWALGDLLLPQPSTGVSFAWYNIQSSVPSGLLKKELCPVPNTDFSFDC